MAFAMWYELPDLQAIADTINVQTIPGNLRNEARRYWDAGLSGWATAPLGQSPADPPGSCPNCHQVVITYGTLAAFRQLLIDIANAVGTETAQYLIALSNDMGGASGAMEPWNG